MMALSGSRKVIVSREGVRAFNLQWPCSPLSSDRHYWFEFEGDGVDGDAGDLVDCDVPEHSDGDAAAAMAEDAKHYLETGELPAWAF